MCSGAHFPGGTHITVRPGPQFPDILGTPGSPNSYDIRDPYMKKGRETAVRQEAQYKHHALSRLETKS